MAQKKYASLSTLQNFLENLKTTFASLIHTHSYDDLRNKPFYEGTDYSSVLVNGESTVSFYDWGGGVYGAAITNAPKVLTQNVSCKVIWDGREYTMTSTYAGNNDSGNPITSLGAPYGDYSSYPFGIDSYQTASGVYEFSIHTNSDASTHTIDILEFGSKFVTLDDRFISDNIARTIDVDTAVVNINTSLSGKADLIHNHDDLYYTQVQIDSKLSGKSDTTHNHDSAYAAKDHNHNGIYAVEGHNHDDKYDLKNTASSAVSTHNTSTSAHNDIRDLIAGLTNRLNTIANSDDTTLDQLSEIVAYIKANKALIDSVTTNKVNVADIVNNLTTNVTNKPLSAAQGVAIKTLIDALQAELDNIVTQEAVILPATSLTVKVTQGDGKFSTFGSDYAYNQELVVGGIYEVDYDGKKYTCTAVDSLSYNNTTYQYTACLGGINEGYPFIIGSNSRRTALAGLLTTGESVAATQAGTATHTISISIPRTINPELIPTTLATKDYVNASVDTKANVTHNHEIADVTDLQTTLDTMQESINSIPQSDWNQNNSAQLDYIKNRTHWVEQSFTQVLSERSILDGTSLTELRNINAPDSCIITLDNVQYQCDMWVNSTGEYCFGDSRIVTRYDWDAGTEVIDTSHPENTPFYISVCGEDDGISWDIVYDWYVMFNSNIASTAHTISISVSTGEGIYHQLDERFIPSAVARTSAVTAISNDLNETQLQMDTKASVATLTTAEYEALEQAEATNANTLYMITDAEEEVIPTIQFVTWEDDD